MSGLRRALAVAGVALAVLGCAQAPPWEKARRVTVGMTPEQAIAIMGRPDSDVTVLYIRRLIWVYPAWKDGVQMRFVDGRLAEPPLMPPPR